MSPILRIIIVFLSSAIVSAGLAYLIYLIKKKIRFPNTLNWFFIVFIPMITTLLVSMVLFEGYSGALVPNVIIVAFITGSIINR